MMVRLLSGAPPTECGNRESSAKSDSLLIVCFLIISLVQLSQGQNGKRMELRREILSHYNKSIPPNFQITPTDVGITYHSSRIQQFDEAAGTLTVEGWLVLNWMDKRLSWNDPEYHNITWFSTSSSNLWLPKISAFNSGRGERLSNFGNPVTCRLSGHIWWGITAELHPVCKVEDHRWYPIETYICTISIGSLYPQEIGDFLIGQWQKPMLHSVYREGEMKSAHWDLLNLELRESYIAAGAAIFYLTDDFIFTIRRQGWPLLATFLPLMVWCTFLSWSSFALPLKQQTKRLSVAACALFLSSISFLVLVSTLHGGCHNPPIIVNVNLCVVVVAFFSSLHTIVFSRVTLNQKAHLNVLQKLPLPAQHLLGLGRVESEATARDGNSLLANMESPPDRVQENLQQDLNCEDQSNSVKTAYDRVHLILQLAILTIVITFLCLL